MKPVAPRGGDSATKSALPTEIHWGQLIVAPRWGNIGTIIRREIPPMSMSISISFSEDALTVQVSKVKQHDKYSLREDVSSFPSCIGKVTRGNDCTQATQI